MHPISIITVASANSLVCGALSDGDERYPRPEHELCKCKDGWGGINCNGEIVCDETTRHGSNDRSLQKR